MDYEEAARYWEKRDEHGTKAPDARERLEAFLAARHVCALATGHGDAVRCTPIEYGWHDGAFWLFSEGGRKFAHLAHNPHVCLAVFDSSSEFGSLHSVQIQGTATIVEPFSAAYLQALAAKHIPEEAARKAGGRLHLIKVVPQEADFLDSSLRADGYSIRQHIVFSGAFVGKKTS